MTTCKHGWLKNSATIFLEETGCVRVLGSGLCPVPYVSVETSGSTGTHTSLMECNVFRKQSDENCTADTYDLANRRRCPMKHNSGELSPACGSGARASPAQEAWFTRVNIPRAWTHHPVFAAHVLAIICECRLQVIWRQIFPFLFSHKST
jgi:hypothetical protein